MMRVSLSESLSWHFWFQGRRQYLTLRQTWVIRLPGFLLRFAVGSRLLT